MNYLQPYKGKDTRHTCPSCGQKQSFTLYLYSNTNNPIHRTVGKCNRESKCGYHYTPKQYFMDNPSSRTDAACHVSKQPPISENLMGSVARLLKPPLAGGLEGSGSGFGTIPFSFVEKSASYRSNFVRFLCEILTDEQINSIGENYALGATKNKEVIFWQIDIHGKVRTGKIMQYNPETGRRLKHESGAIDWVHNKLKKFGTLPEEYNLQQCFFGEHLLKLYPDKPVAIVESEKSALIASAVFPDLIWLAAGNLNGLSLEKCQVLKGRNVTLFPDLGGYEKWSDKARIIEKECDYKITISTLLENIASESQRSDGLDIADFMIEQLRKIDIELEPVMESYFSPELQSMIERNTALLIIIDRLKLEEI